MYLLSKIWDYFCEHSLLTLTVLFHVFEFLRPSLFKSNLRHFEYQGRKYGGRESKDFYLTYSPNLSAWEATKIKHCRGTEQWITATSLLSRPWCKQQSKKDGDSHQNHLYNAHWTLDTWLKPLLYTQQGNVCSANKPMREVNPFFSFTFQWTCHNCIGSRSTTYVNILMQHMLLKPNGLAFPTLDLFFMSGTIQLQSPTP